MLVVALLASWSAVAAQEPKKSDKDGKTITVTGCVDGGYLRVASDGAGVYSDRFRLAGPKRVLKEIAAMKAGHQLEVTGHVIDPRGTEHVGHTTKIGDKTSVYVGGKDVPVVPTAETTSTLQIESYVETSVTCKS
jgi:hypothetical protein